MNDDYRRFTSQVQGIKLTKIIKQKKNKNTRKKIM